MNKMSKREEMKRRVITVMTGAMEQMNAATAAMKDAVELSLDIEAMPVVGEDDAPKLFDNKGGFVEACESCNARMISKTTSVIPMDLCSTCARGWLAYGAKERTRYNIHRAAYERMLDSGKENMLPSDMIERMATSLHLAEQEYIQKAQDFLKAMKAQRRGNET